MTHCVGGGCIEVRLSFAARRTSQKISIKTLCLVICDYVSCKYDACYKYDITHWPENTFQEQL